MEAIETASRALVQPDIYEGNELLVFAEMYEIVDQDTANILAEWRNDLKKRKAAVIAKLAPAKKKTHEAWKEICALETEATNSLDGAGRIADKKLLGFKLEQDRIADEKRRADDARAAVAAKQREEELAVAAELEEAGRAEEAAAIVTEIAVPVIAPPPASKPAIQGLTFRETFRAEVVDKGTFLKAIASNPSFFHLVEANMTALNQLARSQKEALKIPGVRVIKEKQVATGR